MKNYRSFLRCTLILLGALDLYSQQPAQPASANRVAVRDSQAIVILTSAVAAMGGAPNIERMQTCIASGTFSANPESWLRFKSFVWKNAGDQYRYELTDADGATLIERSGQGRPTMEIGGKRRHLNDHSPINAAPAHLAAMRLGQILKDPKFDVLFDGVDSINGRSVYKVKTRYNLDPIEAALTQQEWYFDQNFLPIRIDYQVGEQRNAAEISNLSADLEGYSMYDGVMIPTKVTFSMDRKLGGTATLSAIQFNPGLSNSEFD